MSEGYPAGAMWKTLRMGAPPGAKTLAPARVLAEWDCGKLCGSCGCLRAGRMLLTELRPQLLREIWVTAPRCPAAKPGSRAEIDMIIHRLYP